MCVAPGADNVKYSAHGYQAECVRNLKGRDDCRIVHFRPTKHILQVGRKDSDNLPRKRVPARYGWKALSEIREGEPDEERGLGPTHSRGPRRRA